MTSVSVEHSESPHGIRLRRIFAILGPFLALIVIVLLFGFAIQFKAALDQKRFYDEQAARQRAEGQASQPVPSLSSLFWQEENQYLSIRNYRNIANQTAVVGIAAMGMTVIIIAGGIDLSVGSVIALACVVTAWCLKAGLSPVPSSLAGILTGAVCGLLIALMITGLRVVPFIATLGMLGIARGLAEGIAREQQVVPAESWLGTHVLVAPPEPAWLVVAPGVWLMLVITLLAAVFLRYTMLGRFAFAIGSNESAARLCGIHIDRTKIYLYTIAGLTTGLAGVLQFSRLTVGAPTTAMGLELDVIAAVVIGGGSLSGGEGSVLGSLIGAFIMAFLRSGCDQIGIPNWVQKMIIGGVIVLAVALDQWRHAKTVK